MRRLLREHVEELARLITLETGKAIRTESRVEAGVFADVLVFYGGLGSELKGESVPFAPDVLTVTQREPLGVVGAIIPWNVPLLLMALKIAPALVAGNTVVVKSAEEAPLAVLRTCQLMNQVLPPGVLQHAVRRRAGMRRAAGRAQAGAQGDLHRLGRDRAHRRARRVREADPGHAGTRRQEPDDRVQPTAISTRRWRARSSACASPARARAAPPRAASMSSARSTTRFVDALAAKVDAMVMGDPLDEKTDIGTIISREQFDKVQAYHRGGRERPPGASGARLLRHAEGPAR